MNTGKPSASQSNADMETGLDDLVNAAADQAKQDAFFSPKEDAVNTPKEDDQDDLDDFDAEA